MTVTDQAGPDCATCGAWAPGTALTPVSMPGANPDGIAWCCPECAAAYNDEVLDR